MRGIADGAGVPFDAILVLNCRSELMFAAARSKGETPPGECTSFAVTPEASSDGHTLLGQNWDWVPFARDVCVLLDVQRDDSRRSRPSSKPACWRRSASTPPASAFAPTRS